MRTHVGCLLVNKCVHKQVAAGALCWHRQRACTGSIASRGLCNVHGDRYTKEQQDSAGWNTEAAAFSALRDEEAEGAYRLHATDRTSPAREDPSVQEPGLC